ncbi:insulinase family protein [Litorilituus sediminis]|uniref:Protease 3 n=1 Tax=Litorilituus sediminis TaxID=718192 RepID=A0A4P6P7X1_9GAMM|nr:insulinase family protein [Litorilituus sediminis]QBG37178.1 hypothetical protein EMK97_16295 [Litorilituus sediminis]
MFTLPSKRFAKSISAFMLMLFLPQAYADTNSIANQEQVGTDNILITSQLDEKSYLHFTLDNGIRALVISDKNSHVGAASLVVNVGHYNSPKAYLGLAHLLEHAVFWGSKNFPNTNEFDPFIKKNQGWNNGSTRDSNTRYHFQVTHQALDEALHRFADFIAWPLLSQASIEKSLIAVDNEFNARISDWRKTLYVLQNETNPKHPASKFAIGNKSTLTTDTSALKKALTSFHQQYYGAQNMTLVVYGKESINDLKTMVIKRFSEFPKTKLSGQAPPEPLHLPSQLATKIEVLAPSSNPSLDLRFELPANSSDFPHNTYRLISHLLGHEAEGSLYSYLKAQGWISHLQVVDLGSRYVGKLDLYLELTNKGLMNKESVIAGVFSYIDMLKSKQLPLWTIPELQATAIRAFNFPKAQEPGDWISDISEDMHLYPSSNWLNHQAQISDSHFAEFLKYLTPNNMQLVISHNDKSTLAKTNKIEPILNTHYRVTQLEKAQLDHWSQAKAKPSMHFPKRNPFLANVITNNKVTPLNSTSKNQAQVKPSLSVNSEGMTLWSQNKTDISKNKISASLRIYDNANDISPIVRMLFANMAYTQLTSNDYFAHLAGLGANIRSYGSDYIININGYSENYFDYANLVLTSFFKLKPTQQAFDLAKQKILSDINYQQSQSHAYQQLERRLYKTLLNKPYDNEIKTLLANYNYQDFLTEFKTIQTYQISGVITGDVNTEVVQKFATNISHIDGIKLASGLKQDTKVKQLAQSSQQELVPLQHSDAAINYLIQSQDNSLQNQAMYHLTQSMIARPYHYSIRDEQSLAYFVDVDKVYVPNSPSIVLFSQSGNSSVDTLISATNKFLTNYARTLANMSEGEFQAQLTLSINKLNSAEFSLSRHTNALATELYATTKQGDYAFDKKEKLTTALGNINKASFEQFYRQQIIGNNSKRLLLYSQGKLKS